MKSGLESICILPSNCRINPVLKSIYHSIRNSLVSNYFLELKYLGSLCIGNGLSLMQQMLPRALEVAGGGGSEKAALLLFSKSLRHIYNVGAI